MSLIRVRTSPLSRGRFEELYDRCSERTLVFITRRVLDPQIAADLWGECWAIAFEQRGTCRAATAVEEEGWVFAIARRLIAYYYRKGRIEQRAIYRLRWQLDPVGDDDHQRLIELAGLDALRDQLAAGLAELTEREREALELRVVQELEYPAVAQTLGCSEQAARTRVSRALRSLASRIDYQRGTA
jgi:RNA polymerase sigma factor (sigma-70 family)